MSNSTDLAKLIKRFQHVLPESSVLAKKEQLYPYECDALTAYRQLPLLALLPSSYEEIKAIVEICRESKLPIVARGAGTSLSGGALPHAKGILLNFAKLNKIIDLLFN